MRSGLAFSTLITIFSLFCSSLSAQEQTPYILNGSALQLSCNCYQLTPDQLYTAGSIWNKNLIDLGESFNYVFNVFLGCKDALGADGIAFVLQPIGTNLGTVGQGLGFFNVYPSVGITIDTWANYDFRDPYFDHIGIYKNGDLMNGSPNNLAGPVSALADNDNIEDCQWHTFRIIWDAASHTLSAEIDNVPRVSTKIDLVNEVFQRNGQVYWGFTSATGGKSNIQKVCTSLNPDFTTPADQNFCAPANIQFLDKSTSFGKVTDWWWDFGDGSKFYGQLPPLHHYELPGNYTVLLNIKANNGCTSDTLRRIVTIGSIPVAGFSSSPPVICAEVPARLDDQSLVEFGTISEWNWIFNLTDTLVTNDSSITRSFPTGALQIELIVKSAEGCVSEPVYKTLQITQKPLTGLSAEDACYGDPVQFTATNVPSSVPIRQWYWLPGDGQTDSSASLHYYYSKGGTYNVSMYALNYAGCSSDTGKTTITIYQTQANAGRDTIVAFGQPLQLKGTGGDLYQWTPFLGLDNAAIANPVAVLNNDISYVLKAYTIFGCATYDSIHIRAYKGPQLYVPNAFSPDNNGVNDRFHPVAVGMESINYFEVYNRLGQKVYSNANIGQGWDGTVDGRPQPMGVYVWMIKGTDYLGIMHTEKGTVVLIR